MFVDPFTQINSITLDGAEEPLDSSLYTVKQWDFYNGDWYNLIEFKLTMPDLYRVTYNGVIDPRVITINADWGFGSSCQNDLNLLWARLFAMNSKEQTIDGRVKSKKIEDFTVTYSDATTYEQFSKDNASLISKYGQCGIGATRNGSVCTIR